MKSIIDLLARIFIAVFFLFEAFDSIRFYESMLEKMDEYGLSWKPDILLITSVILLLGGGIFLLIGYRSPLAAFVLLLYWLPLTFIIHSFWNDPKDFQRIQSMLFMKNIAIAGGLLMIIVNGSGKYSIRRLLDNRRLKRRDYK